MTHNDSINQRFSWSLIGRYVIKVQTEHPRVEPLFWFCSSSSSRAAWSVAASRNNKVIVMFGVLVVIVVSIAMENENRTTTKSIRISFFDPATFVATKPSLDSLRSLCSWGPSRTSRRRKGHVHGNLCHCRQRGKNGPGRPGQNEPPPTPLAGRFIQRPSMCWIEPIEP